MNGYEDVLHIYNGIPLSHKKKVMPFAETWMQLVIIILSEVTQKENDKNHMISLPCGISDRTQMNLSIKQKHSWRNRHNCGSQGGDSVCVGVAWGGRLGLADASFYI